MSKNGPNQGRYFFSCQLSACNFFLWADSPRSVIADSAEWVRFLPSEGWKLYTKGRKSNFSPDDIIQGSIGDCWWLSALAVVASRSDLIENIVIGDSSLSVDGSATFRFFLEGRWQEVRVDTMLPCRVAPASGGAGAATGTDGRSKVGKRRGVSDRSLMYSRSAHSQLWVPLLEKAYAKAHGR